MLSEQFLNKKIEQSGTGTEQKPSSYSERIHAKTVSLEFLKLDPREKEAARREFIDKLTGDILKDLSDNDSEKQKTAQQNLKEALDKLFVEYMG